MDDRLFPRSSCRATPTTSAGRCGSSAVPALEPSPASIPESIGDRLPTWHPAAIYGVGLLSCYLALSAVTTLVGLAITSWIVPLDGFESFDASPCSGWPTTGRLSSIPFR